MIEDPAPWVRGDRVSVVGIVGLSGDARSLTSGTLGVVGVARILVLGEDHGAATLATAAAEETGAVQLARHGVGEFLGLGARHAAGDGVSDCHGALDGRCVLWIRHESGDSFALVAQGRAEADDALAADAALGDTVVDDGRRLVPGHDTSVDGLSAYVYC
jgi:hypothetical protein